MGVGCPSLLIVSISHLGYPQSGFANNLDSCEGDRN
jgi:hypothetical protein